jgi:hypothetical protein
LMDCVTANCDDLPCVTTRDEGSVRPTAVCDQIRARHYWALRDMPLRVLAVFSNPPGSSLLRLDREDKLLTRLAREFPAAVKLDRQHASEIDDIHKLLLASSYDVIHFSGHGNPSGICLDKGDCLNGDLVSTARLVNLLALPDRPPRIVILLCCYSEAHLEPLLDIAPFVITTKDAVEDQACLTFAEGFYEGLFRGTAVQASFEHALNLMRMRELDPGVMQLSRRHLIHREDSLLVVSKPSLEHDSLLINLDAVKDRLANLGLSEEEFSHSLEKRLRIHFWIFDTPRDRAVIPVGHLLFGEFSWENAGDIVYCKAIKRLRADVPQDHWRLWSSLLASYNDLAACEYRRPGIHPANPENRPLLVTAVELFQHNIIKYLQPARSAFASVNCADLAPHAVITMVHAEHAANHLAVGRLQQTVQELEIALTNYHEVVNGLQPPEV